METDRLRLYGAGITDNDDGVIEFGYEDGKPVWRLVKNMDADGVTIARILGAEVPHPLNIGEYYRLPIAIPHGQPLAGIAHVQARLGERNKFTEPSLDYVPLADSTGEVMVTILGTGLLITCCRSVFDEALKETIASTVTQKVGACITSLRGNYILVTLEQPPVADDYDGLLRICHQVAEIVYAAVH